MMSSPPYREGVERLIWEWVDEELPPPQNARGVRIEVDDMTLVFDDNLVECHRSRLDAIVAIQFNRVLIVNKDFVTMVCQPPEDTGYVLLHRDEETMLRLHACICVLRSNPSRGNVEQMRKLLGEDANLFVKPHRSNKLINRYRVRNALVHRGSKAAVTYERDGEEFSNFRFWDNLEDAVLERLSNSAIANVLEL